jgi:hypothetical protein
MKTVTAPSFLCEIYVAGSFADIERECAAHCMAVGLCVSIEPVRFVYTGGREDGAVVRLVNYPRFPSKPAAIRAEARALALVLITAGHQWSALIVDPEQTVWLTARPEEQVEK